MADKTKTIKNATDPELDSLLIRLRKENECQRLISEMSRQAASGYIPWDQPVGISTEKPIEDLYHADKTKTIKNATDEELDELIKRLGKENQLQRIISEIKRQTVSGYVSWDQGQEISTEKPIEDLYHFGIPGMRWGVRRSRGSSGKSSKSTKSELDITSEDHKKKMTLLSTKHVSQMTNSELKDLTARLQLEKQYRDLTKKEASPVKKFVMDLLLNASKEVAGTYVKKYLSKGMASVLKDSTPPKTTPKPATATP